MRDVFVAECWGRTAEAKNGRKGGFVWDAAVWGIDFGQRRGAGAEKRIRKAKISSEGIPRGWSGKSGKERRDVRNRSANRKSRGGRQSVGVRERDIPVT